tara:strand:- start:1192 stop:1560 length:369 start_codon:yes stop_codon:yes gene_type:complete
MKNKQHSLYKEYSGIKSLKRDGKIDKNFLSKIDNLSLEELITVKLELSIKSAGGYLYGLQILRTLDNLVKESVYGFALSVTKSRLEAARLLGTDIKTFDKRLNKFKIKEKLRKEKLDKDIEI